MIDRDASCVGDISQTYMDEHIPLRLVLPTRGGKGEKPLTTVFATVRFYR